MPRLISSLVFLFSVFHFSYSQINPQNVTIVRDKWGVPHIYGKTDADVAYGLAWANAEDYFEIIQEDYLNIKGLNGKLKGIKGAAIDYVVAMIRARDIAIEKYESDISSEFKQYLKAYANGFNAYAKAHPTQIICKDIFPINELDIITGYVIAFSMMSELGPVLQSLFKGETPVYNPTEAYTGSNGIALNSAKTDDGSVFLNINSHQPLDGILSWYEAHLVSDEGMNIYGGLLQGGLTVFHGANENLGWAHTDNYVDLVDVFELKINPKNKNQYLYDGKWETLEERKIPLKVKIAGIVLPVKKKAYWSKYGASLKTKKGLYALRFAANMDIKGAEQWYRMSKANNFTEFYNTLKMQSIPCFNIVYADRFDTLFFISNAMIPIRDSAYQWKGILPGDTSSSLWTNLHPIEDLPQLINPECGYVYNTNNSPFHASCSPYKIGCKNNYTMGYEEITNNRNLRFDELINQKEKLSYEDFKKIKYDIQMPDSILPIFNIPLAEIFKMKPEDYPDITEELRIIQKWDHQSDTNNIAASWILLTGYYLKKMEENNCKLYTKNGTFTNSCFEKAIKEAKKHLLHYFGSTQVTLGELQRHKKGDKNFAIPGFPDVLAAMYCLPDKKGRFKSFAGESYIQLVRFSKDKTYIETINAYGTTNRPNNPHYTDQMELFVKQKTKKVSLDKEIIFKEAESIYHPQ